MEEKQHQGLRRSTVLVVDDNHVVRRVLRGIISQDESLQYIGEATNGEAGLEAVRLNAPDVLCLDVMLPGIDGLAVLEQVRQKAPHTKVVLITGYPTSELVVKARELGAAGFVVKPFNAARVLSCIELALHGLPSP
jgi:two-component system chemotaxis response regulator CheY